MSEKNGFELDLHDVFRGVDFISKRMLEAAERGMDKAMKALHEDAVPLAPELTGELRKRSSYEVTVTGYSITGSVTFSAISTSKKGWKYNYALRLHEWPGTYADPTKPGTGPRFLSRPLRSRRKKYEAIVAAEIREELKKRG